MAKRAGTTGQVPQQKSYFVRIIDQNQNALFRATRHLKRRGFSAKAVQLTTHPPTRAYELRYRKLDLSGQSLKAIKLLYTLSADAIEDFQRAIRHLSKDMQVEILDSPVWDLAPAWPQ